MKPQKKECSNCSCQDYQWQKERYDQELLELFYERKQTNESFVCYHRPTEKKICKKMHQALIDYDKIFLSLWK